ncbi:hypothetical protein [Nocardiopsis sp. FIRDI 009]|uniref:hypothetical protein n=1 Tax=Nocardiopsis sp. FIRDI 009 TaxID=714197 RepID=UPI000E23D49B|nr:hypothetical protein [Nocardiopsis sp. FIRDI 009]
MAVCDFVLDAATLSIVVGVLGLFLYIPVRLGEDGIKGELSTLGFGLLWSLWGIGMSGFGGAFFSFLLVHLLRFVSFVFFVGKVAEYVVPADRFVDRARLGHGARGKLRRVQDACDRVARAQRLIPAFDGRSALVVLREQEWLVACDLARIAPLAEEVRRMEAEAVSDRVRAATHSRARAVEAANRQVDRRLDQIAAYVRPVDAALTAYREWEQLSRLAEDTDDYTDLLAHSGSDPAGPLPHDLRREDALRAARSAFEERVREAHEAADRLASAVR